MSVDYIVAGNVMLDTVIQADGSSTNRAQIGGPATFAYSGIKLWTDSVLQCSNVGADYEELFRPWIIKNNIIEDGIKVVCDRCNHLFLSFEPNGNYSVIPNSKLELKYKWLKHDSFQDFGYMKTKPEEIEVFTKNQNIKGVYLAQNADMVFWKKLYNIKKRDNFKVMWEIEDPWSLNYYLDRVINICKYCVDIFSINLVECQNLFNVLGVDSCIKKLKTLDIDMTLFRVGSSGVYIVTKDETIYLPPAPLKPVIDQTGCGNTSTGGALYAYAEGMDPLMVGIIANVSAAQNIRQFGVIPDFYAVRKESYDLANKLYKEYKNNKNCIIEG